MLQWQCSCHAALYVDYSSKMSKIVYEQAKTRSTLSVWYSGIIWLIKYWSSTLLESVNQWCRKRIREVMQRNESKTLIISCNCAIQHTAAKRKKSTKAQLQNKLWWLFRGSSDFSILLYSVWIKAWFWYQGLKLNCPLELVKLWSYLHLRKLNYFYFSRDVLEEDHEANIVQSILIGVHSVE
jgi:hypothetical protein